ncbi:MAG: alpha/beta hydrolase [Saprospiraceae bacterium]|nr:alpha/beta hydrolase [Saprospiraceae bacterium]
MKHKQIDFPNPAVYLSPRMFESEGVPLVLLHGFCEDASVWSPMLEHLTDLPLVMIDLPGFGLSDMPVTPTVEAYADAVEQALDHLEIDRCVMVGHSLGGYVALEYASKYGRRLAGYGLFHSHPFADTEERIAARQRGIDMVLSGKRDLYVAQLFPNLFAPAFSAQHPEVLNAVIAAGKSQRPEGIVAALNAMITRRDHQQTLKNATCPVLFLLGSEDTLVPLDTAWQTAMLPETSQVEVLEGVGHMAMFEAGKEAAQILHSFYALSI